MAKLDIFADILTPLGSKSAKQVWETLGADKQKQVQPFVVQRWLSGVADGSRIIALNATSNRVLFDQEVSGLMLLTMMKEAMGRNSRLRVSFPRARQMDNDGLKVKVVAEYYEQSMREARLTMATLKKADYIEMAEELGWDTTQIKELSKCFS